MMFRFVFSMKSIDVRLVMLFTRELVLFYYLTNIQGAVAPISQYV